MSVIQSIRERGAWIMFGIIALALIAFILQDGMNRQGHLFGNKNTVGKINGTTINREEFDKKLEQYTRGNSAQAEQARTQLWNDEVNRVLLTSEFDKLGLAFSDKQMNEDLYKPGSQLMQGFTDPKTGIANVDAAKQVIAQIKKSKKQEEINQLIELLKVSKLQALNIKYANLLTQAAYVPKWLAEKQNAESGTFASVSYVSVPYNSIADSTVKVSNDDIMAYAKKNAKLFERSEESRAIQFVTFDVKPSSADSAAALAKIETGKQALQTATDYKVFFAKNNSTMPYYDGYISNKEIKVTKKDSIAKVGVGNVYGPYVDGGNYVVAKLVGVKTIPDTVKIRHILIKTMDQDQQSGQSYRVRDDSTAKHLIDTIKMNIAKGVSFDSLCITKSEDQGSKDKGGVYEKVVSGRMVSAFNDFCFTNGTGSKGIVKTEYGYHYIEILSQIGAATAYNIAYLSKPIAISNETDVLAKNEVSKFLSTATDAKSFEETALKGKYNSLPSSEFGKNDAFVPGLGNSRSLVRWAYENNVGDITKTSYDVDGRYVVAMVTAVNKVGLPSAVTLKPFVEQQVRNEKKAQQIINTKFKGNTLEALAASTGTTVANVDTLSYTQPFVPGLGGNEPKFYGAAFNASNKGKVTEPIAGNGGVFALKVNNIGAKPTTTSVDMVKQQLLDKIKQASTATLTEALKKVAKIEDNRADFY